MLFIVNHVTPIVNIRFHWSIQYTNCYYIFAYLLPNRIAITLLHTFIYKKTFFNTLWIIAVFTSLHVSMLQPPLLGVILWFCWSHVSVLSTWWEVQVDEESPHGSVTADVSFIGLSVNANYMEFKYYSILRKLLCKVSSEGMSTSVGMYYSLHIHRAKWNNQETYIRHVF